MNDAVLNRMGWFSSLIRFLLSTLVLFTPLLYSERFGMVRFRYDFLPFHREDLVYFLGLLFLGFALCRHLRDAGFTCRRNDVIHRQGFLSRFPDGPAACLLMVLLVWLAIGAWRSPVPQSGWQSFRFFLAYLGIFWIVRQEADARLARLLAWVILVPGWLNSILALLQNWGWDPWFETPQGTDLSTGRMFILGFNGNTNFLAPFLLLCLLAAGTLYTVTRNRPLRIFLLASFGLFLVALALTQTIAVLLTLLICLAVVLAAACRFLHWNRARMYRTAAFACLAAIGILLLLTALHYSGIQAWDPLRMSDTYQALVHGQWDRFLHGRYYIFCFVREMILDHPWIGSGLASFAQNSFRYETDLPNLDAFQFVRSYRHHLEAHNEYLQLWAEAGLPALLAVVGLLVIWWTELKPRLGMSSMHNEARIHEETGSPDKEGTDDRDRWYLTAGWALMAGSLLFNALANFTWHLPHLAMMLAVSLGVSVAAADRAADAGRGSIEEKRSGIWWPKLACLPVGFLIAWIGFLQVDIVRSRIIRERIEPYMVLIGKESAQSREEYDPAVQNLVRRIQGEAKRAVELDPYRMENHYNLALIQAGQFQWMESWESLQKAERLRPTTEIYLQMARAALQMQSSAEMRSQIARALRFHPFQTSAQEFLKRIGESNIGGKPYPPIMKEQRSPLAVPRMVP